MESPVGTLLQFLAFQTLVSAQEKLSCRCKALWAPDSSPTPGTRLMRVGARLLTLQSLGAETDLGALPLFKGRCCCQELYQGHVWAWELKEGASKEHPAGCFEGYVWSEILPVLGNGHIHVLGACSSGERLEELIWHGRATVNVHWDPGTHCSGPVLNIRLSSCSFSFTFRLWIFDFTKVLGIQEAAEADPMGKFGGKSPQLWILTELWAEKWKALK